MSVGRRFPERELRLRYRGDVFGVGGGDEIDGVIGSVYRDFDWSWMLSGDRGRARLSVGDLYQDVMELGRLSGVDERELRRRWFEYVRRGEVSLLSGLRQLRRRLGG